MFYFLYSLEPTTQALVRAYKPRGLTAVMQAAEELGSTLATVGQSQAQKEDKNNQF